MNILLSWLVYSVAILVAAYVLPGVDVDAFSTALFAALILGIFNALLKPLLILFTLPLNILTLGLFTFVINAAIILLADNVVDGFTVDNFGWALLFSIVLSLVSAGLFGLLRDEKRRR